MSNTSVSKGFQPKFVPKLIQSSQHAQSSQSEPKAPKSFQSKNKGLVAEKFNWDEEEVSDEEEKIRVQVLMALDDDELYVGKNHARNGEWIDITMKKLKHALQDQLKKERKVNEKWLNSSKKVSQCISEQIPSQKKKILGGKQLTKKSSVFEVKENSFIHASLDYDHEMVPKYKDWVERLKPDTKLPNFNNGRILVPESQTVNKSLQHTEAPTDTKSSKDSVSEPQTPLPPLKTLQGASPSSKVMTLSYQDHSSRERPGFGKMNHTKPETKESSNKIISGPVTDHDTKPFTSLVPTKVKTNDQESKINELTKLVQMLMDEKINSTQMTQELQPMNQEPESSKLVNSSKQI
ncbi:hypothetical protein Tco_1074265 [Tanacetum coccineum]